MNPVNFIQAAENLNVKYTNNGAIQLATTNSAFVDQYAFISSYRELRDKDNIYHDQNLLWSINPLAALRFLTYIRLITRKSQYIKGITKEVQKGQGLRYESILRLMYVAENHPEAFTINNLLIFVAAGCCKDLIQLLEYDLLFNSWEGRKIKWEVVTDTILYLLAEPQTSELMKKYLPQIKSSSACKTERAKARNTIAKYLSSLLFGKKDKYSNTYQMYRRMKSSGTAHQWQQLISRKQLDLLNFSKIHGRALNQLVNSKFFTNHGLIDNFINWLDEQSIINYTGYVYELFKPIYNSSSVNPIIRNTINKQFYGLIELAKEKENNRDFIVVLDTSASMSSAANGTSISCINVGKSLALYFSYLLKGHFAHTWIEFNSTAKLNKWIGDNPVDQMINNTSNYLGSTNFISVARLFAQIKTQQLVEEKDFPKGIICISDCEFDATNLNSTNVNQFRKILLKAGFSESYVDNFTIVLWNLENYYYTDSSEGYEFTADSSNNYYFSGLDGSSLSFLLGVKKQDGSTFIPKNTQEVLEIALNQELLSYLTI